MKFTLVDVSFRKRIKYLNNFYENILSHIKILIMTTLTRVLTNEKIQDTLFYCYLKKITGYCNYGKKFTGRKASLVSTHRLIALSCLFLQRNSDGFQLVGRGSHYNIQYKNNIPESISAGFFAGFFLMLKSSSSSLMERVCGASWSESILLSNSSGSESEPESSEPSLYFCTWNQI